MRTYCEFQPTGFDVKGLGCDDRQDWLVAPCGTNRDADRVTRSNWAVMLEAFEKTDPSGETYEQHSFGHWACGHFYIVLIKPGSDVAKQAEEFEAALADYSILSESHLSDLECSEACEYWDRMSLRERVELCSEAGISIMAARPGRGVPDSDLVWEALTQEC